MRVTDSVTATASGCVEFPMTPNPLYKLNIEQSASLDIPNVESSFVKGLSEGAYTHAWWGMAGPNADVLFPFYHSSVYENPVNGFAFYYDNELDRLLEGARADFDPQGRVEKWRAAQKIIMDAALNIPLAVAMNFSLYDLGTMGGSAWNGVELHRHVNDLYSIRGA